jgi:hypothetical protein
MTTARSRAFARKRLTTGPALLSSPVNRPAHDGRQKTRFIEGPGYADTPRKVEPPPPERPDHGAIFVLELLRILSDSRKAGLSDKAIRNLISFALD